MNDDELDPMSVEGLDARLVNVETILPHLRHVRTPPRAGPTTGKRSQTIKPSNSGMNSASSSPGSTATTSPTWPTPATGSRDAGTHPIAVEELTALMVSHRAAYDTRSAKASSALVNWHQRALWPTLDSLRQCMTADTALCCSIYFCLRPGRGSKSSGSLSPPRSGCEPSPRQAHRHGQRRPCLAPGVTCRRWG